ncbi:hypothetical protein MJD09_22760 [bacterium]|nr:hypothetical protein [bacterium]
MSTQSAHSEREKFQTLVMKAVDGEITEGERAELQKLVDSSPEYKHELEQYKKLKEVTQEMKFRSPTEEVWDRYWLNVYNRLERGVAWIIFSIGCIILLTYGGFKAIEAIIADPNLKSIVKIGLVLVIGGLAALIVSVVREKLFVLRKDPYKEVQR